MADIGSTVSHALDEKKKDCRKQITMQMKSRAYRASIKLRNASQLVLRGQRSGRRYNVPGTGRVKYYKRDSKDGKHKKGTATITYKKYQASAPGEPPAVRTGAFRLGWHERSYFIDAGGQFNVHSIIENRVRTDNRKYLLGDLMENGSPGGKIAPRPYKDKIKMKAKSEIMKIYKEPYF